MPSDRTIRPERAVVVPRAIAPESGDALPLEDLVGPVLAADSSACVCILGRPGSGKTTALRHLAAVLPEDLGLTWLEDPWDEEFERLTGRAVLARIENPPEGFVSFRLAPWSGDEVLEYILSRHREACASVMTRLGAASDRDLPGGLPDLWVPVLDAMAVDEGLAGPESALRRILDRTFGDDHAVAAERCLDDLRDRIRPPEYSERMVGGRRIRALFPPRVLPRREGFGPFRTHRLLRHETARQHLIVDAILRRILARETRRKTLGRWWPDEILRGVGRRLAVHPDVLASLREICHDISPEVRSAQPTAATLLLAADASWRPDQADDLTFAGLARAVWPGVDLSGADLRGVNLSHAFLDAANLAGADAFAADLGGSSLCSANMLRIEADQVDLRRADLRGAKLSYARLRGADLTGAILEDALLVDAILREAVVRDARFGGASLRGADLAGLDLRRTDLRGADLTRADLTGCRLTGVRLAAARMGYARLRGADLTEASLLDAELQGTILCYARAADIDLEGADLRGADLRQVEFHYGSSRSGRVGSPLASEGTRTGFYTQDAEERCFRDPETIRKANLRGTDLRGARLEGTDFYLVDVRDARHDAEQAKLLRRSGAILE